MDEKEIVPFQTARKLKDIGFNWFCNHYYEQKELKPVSETIVDKILSGYELPNSDNLVISCNSYSNNSEIENLIYKDCYDAPTLWQAQKWLRETKGIAVNVIAHDGGKYDYEIIFLPNSVDYGGLLNCSPWCITYEDALSAGIDAALDLIANKTE